MNKPTSSPYIACEPFNFKSSHLLEPQNDWLLFCQCSGENGVAIFSNLIRTKQQKINAQIKEIVFTFSCSASERQKSNPVPVNQGNNLNVSFTDQKPKLAFSQVIVLAINI